MKINFFALRLKFFILGAVVVFFLIGLVKKLIPVIARLLLVLAVVAIPSFSSAFTCETFTCIVNGNDKVSDNTGWTPTKFPSRCPSDGACIKIIPTTSPFSPPAPAYCAWYPPMDPQSWSTYPDGWVEPCNYYEMVYDTDNEFCCRCVLGETAVYNGQTYICDANSNFKLRCVPPLVWSAAHNQCECPAGMVLINNLCSCIPPYVYDGSRDICVGPKGMDYNGVGIDSAGRLGFERRTRFFGRGGYEKKE